MMKYVTKFGAMFLGLGVLAAADVAAAADFALVDGIYDGVVTMEPDGEGFCKVPSEGGVRYYLVTYAIRMLDESTVEFTTIKEVDGMTLDLGSYTCNIVGRTLDCGSGRETGMADLRPYGVDAIWTVSVANWGPTILASSTEFVSYDMPMFHTCEGADCDMLAGWFGPEWSFPCHDAPSEAIWTLRQ